MNFFVIMTIVGITTAALPQSRSSPDGRAFSLFSVISFSNDECTGASSKNKGTCFTTDECTNNGGTSDGNCASGFGVCCMFTVSDCTGSKVTKNVTYITNKSYPSSYSTAGTCSYTINRLNDKICQLRLDFDNLVLSEPATGECSSSNTDKLSVTSPTGRATPGTGGLCGDNLSGSHMYVETGNSGDTTLSILIGTATASRTWSIKVIQLECGTVWKAPEDCGQYFTGTSGTIHSYNQPGSQMIQGQNYENCIRQEEGMCSIQYRKVSMDTDATINTASQSVGTGSAQCAVTSIRIPVATGASASEFCGSILSVADAATIDGVVTATTSPFSLGVFVATGTTLSGFAGWKLMYSQVPC